LQAHEDFNRRISNKASNGHIWLKEFEKQLSAAPTPLLQQRWKIWKPWYKHSIQKVRRNLVHPSVRIEGFRFLYLK
jgi:hypothetical protein